MGIAARSGEAVDQKLTELRKLYEPYLMALGKRFLFAVPDWTPSGGLVDNWRTSAWERVGVPSARRAGVELHEGDGV